MISDGIKQYKKGKYTIVEHVAGTKVWNYKHELHREDGPAVEMYDGDKRWFLYDEEYTEEEWIKEMRRRKLEALRL